MIVSLEDIAPLVERHGMKPVLERIYARSFEEARKVGSGTDAVKWMRVAGLLRSIIDEEIP